PDVLNFHDDPCSVSRLGRSLTRLIVTPAGAPGKSLRSVLIRQLQTSTIIVNRRERLASLEAILRWLKASGSAI
ncbi:MAG: hypothetical protein ACRELF_05735, partial [Gemmataceae bacterium]